jgi:hypothetical protein
LDRHHQPPNRWGEALAFCEQAIILEAELLAEDTRLAECAALGEDDDVATAAAGVGSLLPLSVSRVQVEPVQSAWWIHALLGMR